jgi:hypothetical protein
LLVLVDHELVPVLELFFDLLESLRGFEMHGYLVIVLIEWDLLPELSRLMSPLGSFDIHVADTLLLLDGGIL